MKKPFVISIGSVSGGGKTALSVALHTDLSNYLERARYPYLDTYTHKADSDLVLDGWRSLDDLKNDVLAVLNQEIW